jgi:hypothetical protein
MARTPVLPEAIIVGPLSPKCDIRSAIRNVRFTSIADIPQRARTGQIDPLQGFHFGPAAKGKRQLRSNSLVMPSTGTRRR